MRGTPVNAAGDRNGRLFERGAIVRRYNGNEPLRVWDIRRMDDGEVKIRFANMATGARACMGARNVVFVRTADQERIERETKRQQQSTLTVTPTAEYPGGATLTIRRANTAPAPAPKPVVAPKNVLDRPMVERWTVRLWQGEKIDLFEVVDTTTGEVEEGFKSRDMAHDAARELNFR